jgi:uncharacterized membrane protein
MSTIIDAEALFLSVLQPSDRPTAAQVRAAVSAALLACGGPQGCAVALAAEFGEHPETAAARMRWAIGAIGSCAA